MNRNVVLLCFASVLLISFGSAERQVEVRFIEKWFGKPIQDVTMAKLAGLNQWYVQSTNTGGNCTHLIFTPNQTDEKSGLMTVEYIGMNEQHSVPALVNQSYILEYVQPGLYNLKPDLENRWPGLPVYGIEGKATFVSYDDGKSLVLVLYVDGYNWYYTASSVANATNSAIDALDSHVAPLIKIGHSYPHRSARCN